MPTPIFVIGAARTGTTWVANILCRHDDIIGVQAEWHYGIHESAFFWKLYGRFGDLDKKENYRRLVDTYVKTDYFQITGLDEQIFFEEPRPKTYQDFFRRVMDSYAEANSCRYWVEKTPAHSFCISELSEFYPDAIFISIQRDVIGKVKSRIRLLQKYQELNNKKLRIIKEVFVNRMVEVHIKKLPELPNKSLRLQFEELNSSTAKTTKMIFDFLDLEYSSDLLENRYAPNTSYSKENERKTVLSKKEIILANRLFRLSSYLPLSIYHAIGRLFISRSRHKEPLDIRWGDKV